MLKRRTALYVVFFLRSTSTRQTIFMRELAKDESPDEAELPQPCIYEGYYILTQPQTERGGEWMLDDPSLERKGPDRFFAPAEQRPSLVQQPIQA